MVAVGAAKMMYSEDRGNTWTNDLTGLAGSWFSVAWSPTLALFAAVGGTDKCATSPDGKTWTSRTAPNSISWTDIVWSDDDALFVAVGQTGTAAQQVMTSADGITWTARTAAQVGTWQCITYSTRLGLYIAGSLDSKIMTSPDAITWTTRSTPAGAGSFRGVADSASVAIAVLCGSDATDYATSADGITWTARTQPQANTWYDVEADDGAARFVMVSSTGTNRVAVSLDGINWEYEQPAVTGRWGFIGYFPDAERWLASDLDGLLMTSESPIDGETISVTAIPTGTAGVATARDLYMTRAGGSDLFYLDTIDDNSTTTYTADKSDSELGELAPEASSISIKAGDTSIRVQDLSKFSGSGGWLVVRAQILRYTGRSGSSGEGTLTGVPASGIGSIGVDIDAGADILTQPHLTGVTSLDDQIEQGDEVWTYHQEDDAAAQTALAALEGGDGIHERTIVDHRLSRAEAEDRAQAELALFKNELAAVSYVTTDQRSKAGKEVTVNKGAPWSISSQTFKLQRVVISRIGIPDVPALYAVDASSVKHSFEDLLRRARLDEL